jgi:hypothetical protein
LLKIPAAAFLRLSEESPDRATPFLLAIGKDPDCSRPRRQPVSGCIVRPGPDGRIGPKLD